LTDTKKSTGKSRERNEAPHQAAAENPKTIKKAKKLNRPIEFPRRSGILLHPTSFPGPEGIGTLGEEAYRFVDFLEAAGQKLWQILPVTPPGMGNAPYSSHSAFAGNTHLVSAASLVEEGLLEPADMEEKPSSPVSRVNYEGAASFKNAVFEKAWKRFLAQATPSQWEMYEDFCTIHACWLEDYSLYVSLKEQFDETAWCEWPAELAKREGAALKKWSKKLKGRMDEVMFSQFLFYTQWDRLKAYANGKGIDIIGDIPIFVNHDSADVWAFSRFFLLDKEGRLTEQSGVPPDPATGASQIWGHPLYNWKAMEKTGFEWWVDRFTVTFMLVDIIRIDHFCGFVKCWHIPNGAKTSSEGRWVDSPGLEIFRAVRKKLGRMPFITEDLGAADCGPLLEETGFPGMRVLQYAFDNGPENPHLPHNHNRHTVVYTGTHDNNTSIGWFRELAPETKEHALRYLGKEGGEINWGLVRAALASVAQTAVVPLQDILGLGGKARMNVPGAHSGQWEWRYPPRSLTDEIASRLRDISSLYGR